MDPANALHLLADDAVDRKAELAASQESDSVDSSDDETDFSHPIYDTFYEGEGSAAFLNTTNFDRYEIDTMWSTFRNFIKKSYNVGRGSRCPHSARDVLFMTLTVLKHGGLWEFLAKMLAMKGPTSEVSILNFVNIISDFFYDSLVVHSGAHWTMAQMVEVNIRFKTIKTARYATDVTFQQLYRPSGSVQEGKIYYSGKHKLYGYKVEVSVLPNGIAANCSEHYPRSIADAGILKDSGFPLLREVCIPSAKSFSPASEALRQKR